jgi:L-rhamnose isomerase
MKTITFKTKKMFRTIVVTLIVLTSLTGTSKGVNSGKECVEINSTLLTNQVKFWISDNSNWNNAEDFNYTDSVEKDSLENLNSIIQEKELLDMIKIWISNANNWVDQTEATEEELSEKLKEFIKNCDYWSNETENNE